MAKLPSREHAHDIAAILARRLANGGDYRASADGRWGDGPPFSTFDCALMLHELGLDPPDPVTNAIAEIIFARWDADGRIRPARSCPCSPATPPTPPASSAAWAAPAIRGCKRPPASAENTAHRRRLALFDRSARKGPDMEASNPGVTLQAPDALRYAPPPHRADLDEAVETLLAH